MFNPSGKSFLLSLLIPFVVLLSACDRSIPKTAAPLPPSDISICSFNIQFLGSFQKRDNRALAESVYNFGCDVVAVQELVAPPDFRLLTTSPYFNNEQMPNYPDGSPMIPTQPATDFFLEMERVGYDGFVISPEQTGSTKRPNNNSTAGEWFVTFYKSDVVEPAFDLFTGFISQPTAANPDFDRVPYAFGFRHKGGTFDFVLVSVHLHPGSSKPHKERRKVELQSLFNWIFEQRESGPEQDYIVLGDANIEDLEELNEIESYRLLRSLNRHASFTTNTNLRGPKPYDHVFVDFSVTQEVPFETNFGILNLVEVMRDYWNNPVSLYPGDPYVHDDFRQYYSDHHPIKFVARPLPVDDD